MERGGGGGGGVPSGFPPLLHLLVYGLVDSIGLVVVLIVGAAGEQADLVLGVLVAVVIVVVIVVFLLVGALCSAHCQQVSSPMEIREREDEHMLWALAAREPPLAGREQP